MIKKIKTFFSTNINILGLIFLTVLTILTSFYSNYQKKIDTQKYNNLINNIYLKKTLNEIINNLEPKYKTYNHKIKSGETFDKILENYSIDKEEIIAIKENLKKKININCKYSYPEDNPFLILNHYILRSKEEYLLKIKNNPHRKDRYNLKHFNIYNIFILNEIDNKNILDKL